VYVDDFIGLFQAPTEAQLLHTTRAILHTIHCIFPTPTATETQDEPIALKKLSQGDGLWSTQKEILGWLFDSITRTITLPNDKVNLLDKDLQSLSRQPNVPMKDLQCILGRLTHASIDIPNDRGLLSPLIALIAKNNTHKQTRITLDTATR